MTEMDTLQINGNLSPKNLAHLSTCAEEFCATFVLASPIILFWTFLIRLLGVLFNILDT